MVKTGMLAGRRRGIVLARCALAGAIGAAAFSPAPAAAYVQRRSDSGNPSAWRAPRVEIAFYPQGIPGMTEDEMVNATTQAIGAWSRDAPDLGGCSYLELPAVMQAPADVLPDAKLDHVNNITFRSDAWDTLCALDPTGTPVCHDATQLAVTTIFALRSGEVLDADIEVNAVNPTWADLDITPPDDMMQDLQNALTHEMGHFIGLDHTCYVYGHDGFDDPAHPRPSDQNGNPLPDCDNAPADVAATTMFASSPAGETSKRTLEADDRQGVCDIYAAPWHDRFAMDGGGGCAIAGDQHGDQDGKQEHDGAAGAATMPAKPPAIPMSCLLLTTAAAVAGRRRRR